MAGASGAGPGTGQAASATTNGDAPDPGGLLTPDAGLDPSDAAGLHIDIEVVERSVDDGDGELVGRDGSHTDPTHTDRYGSLETLIDAFIEAFNAHDLERALELLAPDAELPGVGGDVAGFGGVVARCWEERPHAILTRGVLPDPEIVWDGQPVAVLWDVGDQGGWARSALLTFDGADDDQLGVIEYVGDPSLIEQTEADDPEPDLPEGASWREWDEGAELV
jgi:hypothetical protein